MKRLCLILICLFATIACGVTTSTWNQSTQDDYKKGTFDNVVATNLGELKLSRAVKTLLDQDPKISSVNALAQAPDGTIYAGTGPQGVLLKIKDLNVTHAATIDGATSLTSLIVEPSGRLLIGCAGDKGRVVAVDKPGDAPQTIFEADGVQYVWALTRTADGNIYAATGPTGKLFEIKPDGSHQLLLDTGENNILSLVSDGADMLYAGTDPHGLIYRVNRKTRESFVVYNAPEAEVGALVLDKKGNLYAATSEAREDRFGPAQTPSANQPHGRPEGGDAGFPIPSGTPRAPAPPPKLPDPNPGEPKPIPKAPKQQSRVSARYERILYFDQLEAADPALPPRPRPAPPAPGDGEHAQQQQPQPLPNRPAPVNTVNAGEPRPQGNAVYKIDHDGFVTEVFRQSVLVLGMVEHQGTLLLATGSEGEIYQVNPAADETVVLAKVDAKQVSCLLPTADGNVYMGMANAGSIALLRAGYASHGVYTSPVLDATQISRFGKIRLHGALPAGTTLTVSTRSGNLKEPTERGWSAWTDETSAAEYLPVKSTPARFMQYRLTFVPSEDGQTPSVSDVSVAYQMPNLAPVVRSVRLGPSQAPEAPNGPPQSMQPAGDNELRRVQPSPKQLITWEASDPNGDVLQYSLAFRRIPGGDWIPLKDKLTDPQFEWDTRTVADGRYEIKVTASDANANPAGEGKTASRVTDSVVVDNTPPVIGEVRWKPVDSKIQLDFSLVDETSTVAACDYSVDSGRDWQMALPVDKIFDSPEETMSFSIAGLKPGQHQVTLRSTDAKGNQSFQTVFVTVKSPVAVK